MERAMGQEWDFGDRGIPKEEMSYVKNVSQGGSGKEAVLSAPPTGAGLPACGGCFRALRPPAPLAPTHGRLICFMGQMFDQKVLRPEL